MSIVDIYVAIGSGNNEANGATKLNKINSVLTLQYECILYFFTCIFHYFLLGRQCIFKKGIAISEKEDNVSL